tara:strand:- start:377 stop:3655 length:3279 start_codon:yes stop_codon:yes gene_type:complete
MSSVTQTIPSYTGGISQQPDELKVPGQVSIAQNVLPDVTEGLLKRPGSQLVASLMDDGTVLNSDHVGKWFHYYRDENEQYVGQIKRDGDVNMWRCSDGQAMTVNFANPSPQSYLVHTSDEDLQTLTLNDYTYVTNRTVTAAMNNITEPASPPQAFIDLKKVAYSNQYAVNIFDNTDLTEVHTATRIKVDRLIDSSNSCDSNGDFPSSGNLPGSGGSTRCNSGTTNFEHDDDMAPNVGTKIFSVTHGSAGDSEHSNGTAYNYSVSAQGGSASDRKRLYFRLTTTGQSVAQGASSEPEYVSRYTTTIDLLYGGEGWRTGDTVEVWMKNAKYKITVDSHVTSKVQANLGLIRPEPTSFDAKTVVTAESIIGAIRADIISTGNFTDANVKIIGNGIYITRSSGIFNLSTPVGELLNVLTDSIKDIADLPNQCKHGYVVKISNSDADEDDYYVKFIGQLKSNGDPDDDNDYLDGNGVWEECAKPGTNIEYDWATMPIQIIREANGTFTVARINWDAAKVGDTSVDGTNPRASFVGYTINKLLFFRNRFVMLSDENVIMSRPGDFTNFWNKSAIAFTTSDPIDISCSSEYPAIVYDGIQVNSGLVLFTKNQQFMLTTDSDVLSPLTAKINFISSYNFNYKTNPFSLGTTVGFLDNAGKNSRFLEMARVLREGEPDIIEQSKLVSNLLDKELDLVSSSRENGLAFFSEKNKKTLYCFKYFNASDKRVQQSWFTWEFKNEIVHHAVLDDSLYLVTKNSRVLTNEIVGRTDNNLTLTNHGFTVGDSFVFNNGGGTALTAGGNDVADDTTFYVSSIFGANSFTISTAADTNVLTLGGGNADMYINYTSNKNVLQKIPLKIHTDSITITDDKDTVDTSDDILYRIHLDNMTTVASSSLSAYDKTNNRTTFTIPTEFNLNSDLSAYVVPTGTDDTLRGLCDNVTVYRDGTTIKASLPGNWKTYDDADGNTQTPTNNIILGQKYDYEVKLPTIYFQSQDGEKYRSDRRGSLVLHRLKLNFGHAGLYETLIERTGKPDYSEIWEPTLADDYLANQVIFEEEITRTVPIYDRNTNTSITIKSSHPSPATLYSMTWEGDYTNRFYSSV